MYNNIHIHKNDFDNVRHQNAQICKLNFKNVLGLCPQTPILGRATAPQTPPPRRSGASRLARGLRPLHRPPSRNPGSTPERTHPLKILATPMSVVMWSNFRLRSMIRAAALSTFCRGWTLGALTRWRTLLQ